MPAARAHAHMRAGHVDSARAHLNGVAGADDGAHLPCASDHGQPWTRSIMRWHVQDPENRARVATRDASAAVSGGSCLSKLRLVPG